ncbi:hypothetical protein A9168_16205 [Macellibacteroides sp. HH-ZS]|nr:hypothetical protein A9168_16205 [Macellibacteroides sp. HH-ZS]
MKEKIGFLIAFILIPLLICAQQTKDVEIKRERVFTGEGLYGYMNGGADLYLEYGVYKLTAKDLIYKGEEYLLEIYELPSSEDAFGIYSLNVFKCLRADTLGCIDCLSAYQLQRVSGNRYISLVFPSGSAKARNEADSLLRLFVVEDEAKPVIPDILGVKEPVSGHLKFARGKLSASNAQPSLFNLLDGVKIKALWHLSDKATRENRALIYPEDKACVKLIKNRIPEEDVLMTGENYIFIKCREEESPTQSSSPFGF